MLLLVWYRFYSDNSHCINLIVNELKMVSNDAEVSHATGQAVFVELKRGGTGWMGTRLGGGSGWLKTDVKSTMRLFW